MFRCGGSPLFLVVLATWVCAANAQTISGIINHYSAVTAIAGNQITVTAGGLFQAGDYVLVIQMQGADIVTSNNASFGDISAYNNAGNFEWGRVASSVGNDVFLEKPLTKTYDIAGKVQLVRVPAYCDAVVTDTLTCAPWNGSTGGVLALLCHGTLTLNADISVAGKGFRGGPTCIGFWGCSNPNYYLNNNNCSGGKKGEGIHLVTVPAYTGGRGKIANGGGGGNPGNCGGGGGANVGGGGLGGYEYNLCFNTLQGIGGQALDYSLGRVFMGGAGGTGFNDNMQTQFPGSNGGGIIFLQAETIVSNGQVIDASGLDIVGLTNDESAGGGGAGGFVCIDVKQIQGTVHVKAKGGKGGDTFNNIFVTNCHGPGGGGGGGGVWFSGSSLPAGISVDVSGGNSGLVLNPSSSCFNTSWGATNGSDGNVFYNYPALALAMGKSVWLGNDTIVCPGQSVWLQPGEFFLTYLWQDSSMTNSFLVQDSGTYWVKVTDSSGCVSTDTIYILHFPTQAVNLMEDTVICPESAVVWIAGNKDYFYKWQDGTTDSFFIAQQPGLYWVEITDSLGCVTIDSMLLTHFVLPPLELGDAMAFCPGDSAGVYAGSFTAYAWNTGSADSAIVVYEPGTYSVVVTDANGCQQMDTIQVLPYYDVPPTGWMNDTLVCPGIAILVSAPAGFVGYLWPDGSSQETWELDQPGSYWLEITNDFGCKSRDTFLVTAECPPGLWLPNAFTPNGDGINDVFKALGYHVVSFHMHIFNRWGELVFVSDHMDRGWDGKHNGMPCELGVYVYDVRYVASAKDVPVTGRLRGNVTLIR